LVKGWVPNEAGEEVRGTASPIVMSYNVCDSSRSGGQDSLPRALRTTRAALPPSGKVGELSALT
jgi:hypothetical protein